jgi:hypothetical protein
MKMTPIYKLAGAVPAFKMSATRKFAAATKGQPIKENRIQKRIRQREMFFPFRSVD